MALGGEQPRGRRDLSVRATRCTAECGGSRTMNDPAHTLLVHSVCVPRDSYQPSLTLGDRKTPKAGEKSPMSFTIKSRIVELPVSSVSASRTCAAPPALCSLRLRCMNEGCANTALTRRAPLPRFSESALYQQDVE